MKYANLYWQNTELTGDNYRAVNIGDNLQFMVIDYLLQKFMPDKEVVKLQVSELQKYSGETLILPMNWSPFDLNYMKEDCIAISDKIIPVFLGTTIVSGTFREEYLNEYNISYLKRYEPIGCRDEYTMNVLHHYGIRAYLNGCLTSIFPKRENECGAQKVFLVDVPREVEQYIPSDIRNNAQIKTQQYYYSKNVTIEEILTSIKEQYYTYAKEAKLIVTSRLHVASPCMAMGIPVIFTKDQIDARFGWLDKYIPLYDKAHYSQIDWRPKPIEYEETKKLIIQNAIKQIASVYEKYSMAHLVDKVYEDREKKKYISFQKTINNFDKAISYLNKYNHEEKFIYSIWGVNNVADNFYEYMNCEYPNAEIKNVIDTYKTMEFHGIPTIKPEDFEWEEEEVIIVLPVKASNEAEKVFARKGIDSKYYVCCGNQFIDSDKVVDL